MPSNEEYLQSILAGLALIQNSVRQTVEQGDLRDLDQLVWSVVDSLQEPIE